MSGASPVLRAAAVILATAATTPAPAGDGRDEPSRSAPEPSAYPLAASFLDGSTLKLGIGQTQIDLSTPYGRLVIPFSDIQRIDFGRRVSRADAQEIDAAMTYLGSPEFQAREAAGAVLLKHGARAYPALSKAAKQDDAEIAQRATELLEKLRQRVPEELLEIPDADVVYTKDSKIVGRIEGDESWAAHTAQFGDVRLRLGDMRRLSVNIDGDDAAPDPGTLVAVANEVGKKFAYRVKGSSEGIIWGTDVYTTDSRLNVAAVHAGVLKPGQEGIVRVEILGVQGLYQGSERNGVTSQPFLPYPGFRFIKR